MLDISNSLYKGIDFMNSLETLGQLENPSSVIFNNDGVVEIKFLNRIGEINNYLYIVMNDNKIVDISVLKNATNLTFLDMANNRIQDVSPLADLDNSTFCIDLRDNCILDYKPIKHLFDEMYESYDMDNNMNRYDYYTNPFDFKFNWKMIKFPYLTTYYKDQAYAEAKPLFEAFGGSAKYDKKTGKLTCKYHGDTYIFSDFSEKYTINGKSKKMSYPMRRMQYDLAYVPTEDICIMLGFTYTVEDPEYDELSYETIGDNAIYKTRLVEITGIAENELG
jgi:Leucine-rich repeat (LRR) protein